MQHIQAENAAQFGDFIGGYVGTIFTLVGVLLLVATLYEQIKEDRDEGFERRFFQLLDYHRENVAAVNLGDRPGFRTFVALVREFRLTLEVVDEACRTLRKPATQTERIDLAYMAFYYGTGPNSNRVPRASLAKHDSELVNLIIKLLDDCDFKQPRRMNAISIMFHLKGINPVLVITSATSTK